MSGAETEEKPEIKKKKPTKEEKRKEHLNRITRTSIACIIGIVTGVICYLVIDPAYLEGLNSHTTLGFLIMVAGVVVQRHIFIVARINSPPLGKKDWFFQGFMTFALWFITWTLLLS